MAKETKPKVNGYEKLGRMLVERFGYITYGGPLPGSLGYEMTLRDSDTGYIGCIQTEDLFRRLRKAHEKKHGPTLNSQLSKMYNKHIGVYDAD